jgi:hypothetical protein
MFLSISQTGAGDIYLLKTAVGFPSPATLECREDWNGYWSEPRSEPRHIQISESDLEIIGSPGSCVFNLFLLVFPHSHLLSSFGLKSVTVSPSRLSLTVSEHV